MPEGEWFCPQCTSEAEDPDCAPAFPSKDQIEGATESLNGADVGKGEKESTPAGEKVGSKRKSVAAGGGTYRDEASGLLLLIRLYSARSV